MANRVPLNLKVTPQLKAWIQAHVELGEYPDPGACVEDAIRRFHEMGERRSVDDLLAEARKSGKSRRVTDADWQRARERLASFGAAYSRATRRRKSA